MDYTNDCWLMIENGVGQKVSSTAENLSEKFLSFTTQGNRHPNAHL